MDRLLKDGSSDIAGGGGWYFCEKKLFLMKLKNVVIEV